METPFWSWWRSELKNVLKTVKEGPLLEMRAAMFQDCMVMRFEAMADLPLLKASPDLCWAHAPGFLPSEELRGGCTAACTAGAGSAAAAPRSSSSLPLVAEKKNSL